MLWFARTFISPSKPFRLAMPRFKRRVILSLLMKSILLWLFLSSLIYQHSLTYLAD